MRGETVASVLNPQTCNLMSAGGGGVDSITSGDIQSAMLACEATPLIWAYYYSYHGIGLSYDKFTLVDWECKKTPIYSYDEEKDEDVIIAYKVRYEEIYEKVEVSNSLIEFESMLGDWIYSNYLDWLGEKNIYKAIKKATTAVEEITKGLARYLSENPKEENRIWPYFKPVKIDTFRRKYKKFAIMASRRLFHEMVVLSNQVDKFTKNKEEY